MVSLRLPPAPEASPPAVVMVSCALIIPMHNSHRNKLIFVFIIFGFKIIRQN